jgi:hypothetical protein
MKLPNSADGETGLFPDIPALEREADVLRAVLDVLRARLPATWQVDSQIQEERRGPDAQFRIRAPGGPEIVALVEAKRLLNTRDVPVALERLRQAITPTSNGAFVLVLVARYLAPATREQIVRSGAGYIDATGNIYLASDSSALLLRDRGADQDPWRGPGRPRGTLKGAPAARVVRALVDFAPPYSIPDLAERAGASTGAAYRVIELLEELQLVELAQRGPITSVQWRAILTRWSTDYGFERSNTVTTFLEPRGLEALEARLRATPDLEYVLTGSMAARDVAPYATDRLAMLYVRDPDAAASALGLRTAQTGANVALATGDYDVALARTRLVDGLRCAALSQVAVDLMSGPGRNPSEAVALLDWMEENEKVCRS